MRTILLVASNLGKLDVPFLIYANFLYYIQRTTKHSYCKFYFFLINFLLSLASSSNVSYSTKL